jgi:hypothetical protein
MNRCNRFRAVLLSAATAAMAGAFVLFSPATAAQGIQRSVPRDVVLGQLTVTAPPQITIDGKPDRLTPGSRIRDLNNMVVLSGGIVGKTLPVVYRRDAAGLVHEAWVLTADEYRKLGGAGADGEGVKRFYELLALIFAARR